MGDAVDLGTLSQIADGIWLKVIYKRGGGGLGKMGAWAAGVSARSAIPIWK
jgi:hypothetical protein